MSDKVLRRIAEKLLILCGGSISIAEDELNDIWVEVFRRDEFKCVTCGTRSAMVRVKNGVLVTMCDKCNEKG